MSPQDIQAQFLHLMFPQGARFEFVRERLPAHLTVASFVACYHELIRAAPPELRALAAAIEQLPFGTCTHVKLCLMVHLGIARVASSA